MPAYTQLINDLFAQTNGAVTVTDANGESFTSHDLIKVGAWASKAEDPWIDLATDEGEAIGLFVAGNPQVVSPQPSFDVDGGMVYMLKGAPVGGQKQGFHMCPLDVFLHKGEVDLAGLNTFEPEDLDICTPGSDRAITLMTGRRRDEGQGRWKPVSSTFGQFTDVLRAHKEGEKDGSCYLQGESADGARKSAAQIANYILGVDLDSGAPLHDVIATISKHGLEAVIYTTHSHLKDTSVIKRDHFMKEMGTSEADEDLIRQYLIEWKGVLPHILEEVEILDDAKHTSEGIVILVRHRPMPKFRAVFPLSEGFVFAKRGGSQKDAILEWKERYAGFCTDMGFFYDEKCVDPARLFYMPRHPAGDTKFGSWLIVGEPLDLDKFNRVKINRKRRGKPSGPANAFTDAAGGAAVDDDDDEADRYVTEDGYNLRGWASKHAKRFEVQRMLEDVIGDDIIREDRGSKPGVHVECPFEAEHSSFGGAGCFVVNASDNADEGYDGGYTFNCTHNACAGRDRLDFLVELCNQGQITKADLTNKEYLYEIEGDEDDARDEPEPVGVRKRDAAVSNERAGKPSSGVSQADERRGNTARDREGVQADIDEDLASDEEDVVLKAFNRRYAVIRTSGGVRILVEPRTADDDVAFESQNDVSLYEKNRVIWTGGSRKGESAKKLEAFKVWLEWEHRRTYSRVVFAPGQSVPRDTYNLFRGWPFEPVATTWTETLENSDAPVPGDWSMLRGHIFANICESDDELFNWFMTWLAMLFQKPNAKPGSTVVITGEKGTGKSTVFDYVNQLLGRCGITVSQRKQIVGQFNGHLATTLLMVCEEAFWAADPQAEGVLKDMITNKSVLIEKKGYDPIQSQNYTRLALISNNEWVVPASLKDERRFFVLRCNSARRGDLRFFEDMREQMEKLGGLEAFLYDLLHWEPINGTFSSLFNPPVTSHLQQQQIESLTGVQKFMLELVKAGMYETNDDNITPIELNEDKETRIYAVDMRAAVQDYVKFRFSSDKAKTSFDDIAVVVTDWFGAREVSMAVEGSTNRKRTFVFPPLDDVRAKLKESKGLDIEAMTLETVKAMKTR
jgi:hypothetical protein